MINPNNPPDPEMEAFCVGAIRASRMSPEPSIFGVGETVTVVFKNPPMESVREYLARQQVVSPRDRFFAALNMGTAE